MSGIVIEVISILSGFAAIWINEILTHKRDIKHKREELKFSHLKEMLGWLNEMQQSIFNLSRGLITLSGIYNNMDRKNQLKKDFNIASNEIIEKSIVFCNSYAEINNILGIDLELKELNKAIGHYIGELRNIYAMYPFPDENDNDLKIVNERTSTIQEQIKKRIEIISTEIGRILLG